MAEEPPADELIRLAIHAVNQCDTDTAQAHLERVVESNPRHVVGLINLGNVCLLTGDSVRAETLFRAAWQAGPGVGHASLGVMKALLGQRRAADAAALFDRLDIPAFPAPLQAEAHYLNGVCRAKQQAWTAAANAFQASLRLLPDQAAAYQGLYETHLRLGHSDAAVDILERWTAVQPDRPDLWFRLLTALHDAADAVRFRRCCDAMLAANPGHLVLHNLAARLYLAQRRYAYALLVYRRIREQAPDFDRTQFTALAQLEQLA